MTAAAKLSALMRVTAIAEGAALGVSHIVFPARWFSWLSQTGFDAGDPFQMFLANMVGVLVVTLCVGLFIAARDPARYLVVVDMLILGGVLTVPVYLVHLVVSGAIGGWEWGVFAAVIAMTVVFYRLRRAVVAEADSSGPQT
ncbi:hypothetical protein K8I61_01100 [bacterium]|nr:hypothetical protein [bacterium]